LKSVPAAPVAGFAAVPDYPVFPYYPYYPYYPPVYSYSYTTGTLLMTLIDPDELNGNGYPIHQWTGVLNGILNDKFDAARTTKLIDQAFDQSQYLKTN